MAIYHLGVDRVFNEVVAGDGWDTWEGGVDADWQVSLFEGASAFTQDQTDATVADVEADANLVEITAVTNYARQNLPAANRVITNATDQNQFDSTADTTFSSLGNVANSTTLRIALIALNSGTDATSAAVCAVPLPGAPVTTNGGDITLQWAAGGIFALDATP